MDLSAILAARMQKPPAVVRPDKPPAGFKPGKPQGPVHATRVETRKVNGRWVLVPVAFAPGKAKAPMTKVSYKPLR